jgi:hypothetical protein
MRPLLARERPPSPQTDVLPEDVRGRELTGGEEGWLRHLS